MTLEDKLSKLLQKEIISVVQDASGTYICSLPLQEKRKTFLLRSKEFRIAFNAFWYKRYSERLRDNQINDMIGFLELTGYGKKLDYSMVNRIYNEDNELIIYDLNQDSEECVWIEQGECSLERTPEKLFLRSSNFKNQVKPNLEYCKQPKELIPFVKKHFYLSDKGAKLLGIYIVACMTGMAFNLPLVMLKGEKGSSKSTSLRKLELIIDPKQSGLCSFPKSMDGLTLRLANSYFTCFDNLSYLSQSASDVLCIAITGGSISDRALFENTTERISNIHSIVALNCIGSVIRSADLLDRTLIIRLSRIPSNRLLSEEMMWQSFNEDLPKILGCCFGTLAQTLLVDEPPQTQERIRMVDFHEFAIKVGIVLGISEDEVNDLLFENQKELSVDAVFSNSAALCLIELMKEYEEYSATPTECLHDLKIIARRMGTDAWLLPKDAARLTTSLEKVKSELLNVYGIEFRTLRGKNRMYSIKNHSYSEME